LQAAIAREEKTKKTTEKKIIKEIERVVAREKIAREKAARTAERR